MTSPPPIIDNARVLWWASAEDGPFGFCGDIGVFGFAICRYECGALYRFSCDEAWETMNDWDFDDEETAKTRIPKQYLASTNEIRWRKYGE